jgi:hypothetical protein
VHIRKKVAGSSVAALTLIAAFSFKWYVAQGPAVNGNLFDDENQWQNDIGNRSAVEYIFLRDLPGYFVIPMRLVLLGINWLGLPPEVSVRVFVTVAQLFCFWILVKVTLKNNQRIKLLTFAALVLIPLEDMNYLHNVGYLFGLVIASTWVTSHRTTKRRQIALAFVCGFLIVKPLVALIVLASIFLDAIFFRQSRESKGMTWFESILFLISTCYLLTYFLLPNDFASPESFSIAAIGKALFNSSWILSSTLLPSFVIGLIGFLRLEYGKDIANLAGGVFWTITSLTSLILIYRYRIKVFNFIRTIFVEHKTSSIRQLLLITFTSYLSVYTVSNFAWVSIWPLWELAYSPRLWMRWASNVPILITTLTVLILLHQGKRKMASHILCLLICQYFFLWLLARDILIRWQGN